MSPESHSMIDKAVTLVTRPSRQEAAFVQQLMRNGFRPHNQPVLEIEPVPFDTNRLLQADVFCITSLNGADRLVARREVSRTATIIAVGPGSATPIRQAGFTNVFHADGTGKSLVEFVGRNFPRYEGLFIHLSGETIACDVAQALRKRGYSAERLVAYRANRVDDFSPNTRALITRGDVKAAIFLSQRTVSEFVRIAHEAGLISRVQQAETFAMSSAIAKELERHGWNTVHVAEVPSADAVITCLQAQAQRLNLA